MNESAYRKSRTLTLLPKRKTHMNHLVSVGGSQRTRYFARQSGRRAGDLPGASADRYGGRRTALSRSYYATSMATRGSSLPAYKASFIVPWIHDAEAGAQTIVIEYRASLIQSELIRGHPGERSCAPGGPGALPILSGKITGTLATP